ncbi:hypothetical protein QQF64_033967 [Cirrhinus molitorella]|uniref:RNase H type-1 domain-containing protein n=1 Tax=Cirrhinus molitorella TaxID=172907 RepID=A0ABR3MVG6_9TELE
MSPHPGRYNSTKEKTMRDLESAEFVSLMADMSSSINMDGCLGVTRHYITPEAKMATVVLGVRKFYPNPHRPTFHEAKTLLMSEWGITSKVQCMVTDSAPKIILKCPTTQPSPYPMFCT